MAGCPSSAGARARRGFSMTSNYRTFYLSVTQRSGGVITLHRWDLHRRELHRRRLARAAAASRLATAGSATPSSASTAPARMITPVAASGATTTSTNEMAGHQRSARTGGGTDHSRISDGMGSSYPITERIMRRGVRPLGSTSWTCRRLRAAAFVDENEPLRHARRDGRPRHAGAHLPGLVAQAAVSPRRAGRPVGGHDRAHRRVRRPARGGRRAAAGGRAGGVAARRAARGARRRGRRSARTPRCGRSPARSPRPGGSAGASTRCWCTAPTPRSPSGLDYAVARERAADGVVRVPRPAGGAEARPADPPLADGVTLHLHATDDGLGRAGEWLVRGAGGGVVWEHGHAQGRRRRPRHGRSTSCSR